MRSTFIGSLSQTAGAPFPVAPVGLLTLRTQSGVFGFTGDRCVDRVVVLAARRIVDKRRLKRVAGKLNEVGVGKLERRSALHVIVAGVAAEICRIIGVYRRDE